MAQNRSKEKFENGFSVIEVIISLFLLGVILLIYNAAVNSVQLNRQMKDQEIAFRIASTEMESLRSTAYNSLPTSSASVSDSLLTTLPGNAGESLVVASPNSKTKKFVVTVNWIEPGNAARSVNLSTLITQGGIGQ